MLDLFRLISQYSLKIFKVKFYFFKPTKNSILLFDYILEDYLQKILKKKFSVLYRRGEALNLYVVFIVILNHGFYNFKKNYIYYYITFVDPKLIITFNDLHPTFYLLKDKFNNSIKTVAIQNGHLIKKSFMSFKYISNPSASINFLLSNYYERTYKFINSKKKFIGSLRNNFYKKTKEDKVKKILFISQFQPVLTNLKDSQEMITKEKKLIKYLNIFNNINNIPIIIATKLIKKEIYKKYFKVNSSFKFIDGKNFTDKYNYIDRCHMTIFMDSTLGMESLSRGNKVVSFPLRRSKNILNSFYTSSKLDYKTFSKKVDYIFQMKKSTWRDKIKTGNKFVYNPQNTEFKKTIESLL